ncbi:MAG: helix-turn-helix domain-containing protein [Lachnospiraceae bacterium]|nr:helix-turn-helix domain-containing protein [Lachnospiraceae bacterium]
MTLDEMKRIKQERGYSLAQLSELSGVPLGTVQKIFSGETTHPRYATLQALESVLFGKQSGSNGTEYLPDDSIHGSHRVEEAMIYELFGADRQGKYTLQDYYAIPRERRVELIDGVIYDMSALTFVHQHILGTIFTTLQNYIAGRGGQCLPMMAPVDVRLDRDDKTMVQPDILILCDKSKICKWGINGAPDFCLEIVSESTGRKDYIKKLQKYTEAGVKEYWIIDPFRKVLVIYHWKDDYLPHMVPLEGKRGLVLYDEELLIDLDTIAALIQEYPEN